MLQDYTMSERRKKDRVQVDLKVYWEGALAQLEGNIVDLSASGCFILSADLVRLGELIRVAVQLPDHHEIYVWGVVVYQIAEMGFALNFTGGDDADLKLLSLVVKAERHKAKKNSQLNCDDAQPVVKNLI
jgi:hypothetical protein